MIYDSTGENLRRLAIVAEKMGPVKDQAVFLGGAAIPLLLTQPVELPIRRSKDVDVVFHYDEKEELHAFEDVLWERGFQRSGVGVVSNWTTDRIKIDILPTGPGAIGFYSPWGRYAVATAQEASISSTLKVKIVSSPCFIAYKLIAFRKRGNEDYPNSSDIYDIILLFAGRPEIENEFSAVRNWKVATFVKRRLRMMLEKTNRLADLFTEYQSRNLKVSADALESIADRMQSIICR